MATYQKRGDTWRAIIRLKGVTESKTFPRKADATAWATERETEIRNGDAGKVADKTLAELLDKYEAEVTEQKPENRTDKVRLNNFRKDPMVKKRLEVVDQCLLAEWRDRRLKAVAPGTVLREMNMLGGIFNRAIEWKWLKANPMTGVQRPDPPASRKRQVYSHEIDLLCFSFGYDKESPLKRQVNRIGAAFLFALETGMREGEIACLKRSDVFLEKSYLKVRGEDVGGGKTAAARRDVALSQEAIRILKQLPDTGEKMFGISGGAAISDAFTKHAKRLGINDLVFHDTRHEAITRLCKKLDVLSLARMIGHADIRELNTYYNATAEDIAKYL